ncbi:hypothetical protein HDU91_002212 [Kappamyces sp. JEL0680]|nr:hypothetical protein HDU91_002212 [Kappamyces sp. JEL0680]
MSVCIDGRAIETCRKRCVSNEYKFDQLGRAEAVCSDRCISKFFEASQLLQELTLKEMQKKQDMLQVCQEKCFDKSQTSDCLTKGETLCVDRCITKFFAVAQMLEEKSKEKMDQLQGTIV